MRAARGGVAEGSSGEALPRPTAGSCPWAVGRGPWPCLSVPRPCIHCPLSPCLTLTAHPFRQIEMQYDARSRMEIHAALKLLATVDRERHELHQKWFGGGQLAVQSELLAQVSLRARSYSDLVHAAEVTDRAPA